MTTKRGKRGGKKTVVDGIIFPSKLEAERYRTLSDLQENGTITNLRLQVCYPLIPSFRHQDKAVLPCRYYADFVYTYEGGEYIEDTKAKYYQDPVYKLKKKLLFYTILRHQDHTFFYEVYDPGIHPRDLQQHNRRKNRKTRTKKTRSPNTD